MSYRILIMEKDKTVGNLLHYILHDKGNKVEWCQNDDDAVERIFSKSFDLIIMDASCPGQKGFKVLTSIRKKGNRTPVIILSSRSHEGHIIRALSLGAEAVICKPFGTDELIARIHAVMRRINENVMHPVFTNQHEQVFRLGFLDIFPERLEIFCHDNCITFDRKEFIVLLHFLKNPGIVFSENQLIEVVQCNVKRKPARIVHLISSLRKKIQIVEPYIQIHNISSVGYKLSIRVKS